MAISGTIRGTRFPLRTDEPIVLGRTNKGIHVPDPEASLQHAKIEWFANRYWITDLDSAFGTYLDGARITPNERKALALDSVVKIGETELKLTDRSNERRRTLSLAVGGIAGAGLLVGAAVLGMCGGYSVRAQLGYTEPIRFGATRPAARTIDVDLAFVRERGVDWRALRIRRLSDNDVDGIDELWLTNGDRDWMITFEPDGRWRSLGDLPGNCEELGEKAPGMTPTRVGFPALRCGGEEWTMTDGRYRLSSQVGTVVWLEPPVPKPPAPLPKGAKPPPPVPVLDIKRLQPARLTMRYPERLAGFLVARGVTEPIHYLVCEGAFEGEKNLQAQVLTASGKIVPLAYGCLRDLDIHAKPGAPELGRPLMMAFTAHGRQALFDDLQTHFGGGTDAMWLPADAAADLDMVRSDPGSLRGGALLEIAGDAGENAIAEDLPLADAPRQMLGGSPPPVATHAQALLAAGETDIVTPGCATYHVKTNEWRCGWRQGCLPWSTFVSVTETGCGADRQVLKVGYAPGIYQSTLAAVPVRVAVESASLGGGYDVLSAKIGWQDPAPPP